VAYTTPKTWTAGAALTAAELNEQIRDNVTWLKAALTTINQTSDSTLGQLRSAAYGCVLNRNTTLAVNDTTSTVVPFPTADATEELDSNGFHSGATNTARITIPAGGGGWYDIGANVQFEADADGRREVWIERNGQAGTGTTVLESAEDATPTSQHVTNISGPTLLVAGDYLTLNVLHTAGAAINLQSAGAFSIRFWALRRFAV